MQKLLECAVCGFITLFGLVSVSHGQLAADPNAKQAKQSITGPWQANSVTTMSENGTKKTLSNYQGQQLQVIISEKTLTMRVGDKQIAEMSYVMDSKQTPPIIDMKFQGHDMLGIYELSGDKLIISLNDVKKGRPKSFGGNDSEMELTLSRYQGEPLIIIEADGSKSQALNTATEFTSCGSPEWSHDGSKIAFDCWRSILGEFWMDSHVFIVNIDGTAPIDLGDGAMPSWSPDSKHIAYTRRNLPDSGVWIINADGTDKRLIDSQGSGVKWSPKKDELAYTKSNNICVLDLKSKIIRDLLKKKYTQIYRGLSWSPDAQWICFKGDLPEGGSEVAIIHAEGEAQGHRILLPNKLISGVEEFDRWSSWSPDGKHIVMALKMEDDYNRQLYIFDPDGKALPKKLAGQDPSLRYYGSSWSPDGKRIVVSFNFGMSPGSAFYLNIVR